MPTVHSHIDGIDILTWRASFTIYEATIYQRALNNVTIFMKNCGPTREFGFSKVDATIRLMTNTHEGNKQKNCIDILTWRASFTIYEATIYRMALNNVTIFMKNCGPTSEFGFSKVDATIRRLPTKPTNRRICSKMNKNSSFSIHY